MQVKRIPLRNTNGDIQVLLDVSKVPEQLEFVSQKETVQGNLIAVITRTVQGRLIKMHLVYDGYFLYRVEEKPEGMVSEIHSWLPFVGLPELEAMFQIFDFHFLNINDHREVFEQIFDRLKQLQ